MSACQEHDGHEARKSDRHADDHALRWGARDDAAPAGGVGQGKRRT